MLVSHNTSNNQHLILKRNFPLRFIMKPNFINQIIRGIFYSEGENISDMLHTEASLEKLCTFYIFTEKFSLLGIFYFQLSEQLLMKKILQRKIVFKSFQS